MLLGLTYGFVQDEMRQGLSYFHETIFSSLPVFQRRIDTALKNIGQPMLPLEHNLFHFGSWMGGDRDGNPFVTPETTREVVITARLSAVNLYFQQIEQLMFDLSTWRCNAELQVNALQCNYRCCCFQPVQPPVLQITPVQPWHLLLCTSMLQLCKQAVD